MAVPSALGSASEPALVTDVRTLLGGAFGAVRATVVDNNPGMGEQTAGRIVDEAVKFMATAARFPREVIVPSRVVDEGWHALILHTRTYRELCDRLGLFVHHTPERPDPARYSARSIERTTALIEKAGFPVDAELWGSPSQGLAMAVAANCQHSDDSGPIVIVPKPPSG